MSHFSLEAEIQSAVRMDSSINVCRSAAAKKKPSTGPGPGPGPGLNTSSKLSTSGLMNRSRSESRLHTALFSSRSGVSPARGQQQSLLLQQQRRRSGSRGRPGGGSGSLLDLSSAGLSKSPGRIAADRFIPNRSTTDMEFAQHSLSK